MAQWEIDHINNVKTDNRICNLREASNNENGWNAGKPSTNTSGVKGVSWDAEKNKWKAHCRVFGKKYTVGRFSSKEYAERAVAEFREKHHGEFFNHG
ncbi:TPA: HNH endonuclease [Escherichia coli]